MLKLCVQALYSWQGSYLHVFTALHYQHKQLQLCMLFWCMFSSTHCDPGLTDQSRTERALVQCISKTVFACSKSDLSCFLNRIDHFRPESTGPKPCPPFLYDLTSPSHQHPAALLHYETMFESMLKVTTTSESMLKVTTTSPESCA